MTLVRLDRRSTLAGLAASMFTSRRTAGATEPWRWAVDYGANTDPALARRYDLLVLEPDHARPIEPLRGPSSVLLGYISVGEVEQSRPFAERLRKADALIMANPNWPDARMIDLRNPVWTSLMIEELVPAILAKGYDGIFLDTLDNAEALERANPTRHAGMVAAGVAVIQHLRAAFPSIRIMLNRGYALLPQAAEYVDVILGEAMASRWNFADKRYELTSVADWTWQADRLRSAKEVNPAVRLAVLDYWDPADRTTISTLYRRERSAGFLPYVATLALDRIHPEWGAS